jgi:hypothetical protein
MLAYLIGYLDRWTGPACTYVLHACMLQFTTPIYPLHELKLILHQLNRASRARFTGHWSLCIDGDVLASSITLIVRSVYYNGTVVGRCQSVHFGWVLHVPSTYVYVDKALEYYMLTPAATLWIDCSWAGRPGKHAQPVSVMLSGVTASYGWTHDAHHMPDTPPISTYKYTFRNAHQIIGDSHHLDYYAGVIACCSL